MVLGGGYKKFKGLYRFPFFSFVSDISEMKWKSLSCVWLFVIPLTVQSMEFSRSEYWSG